MKTFYIFKDTDNALAFIRYLLTKIGEFKVSFNAAYEICVEVTAISAIVNVHVLDKYASEYGGKKS